MSRLRLVGVVAALILAWATLPLPALAHQMNLSTARIELAPNQVVAVEVALKGSDVDRALGTALFNEGTGLVEPDRLAAASAAIAAYVTSHAVVEGKGGALCKAGPAEVAPDQDGVAIRVVWSCGDAENLVYRSTVLTDIDRAARQVVLLGNGPEASQVLLDATRTEIDLAAPPPPLLEVIGRYVEAGIEHIFLGYDHIAFLIAVVLWARRLWPVIKIVTAFTLAHSVTLSLAALQVVVIPSAIVEPAIALSIVFVAVENFFSRDVGGRWRVTFAFGLIHGFGFASALQELGLPRGSVMPALGAFNLGVEIGQVAIVSLVIPTLIALDRVFVGSRRVIAARSPPLVYALSGVIAILGCYWILARTVLT
jgi:hydrogenase/urease accessory protein HupE